MHIILQDLRKVLQLQFRKKDKHQRLKLQQISSYDLKYIQNINVILLKNINKCYILHNINFFLHNIHAKLLKFLIHQVSLS
jgi:hypothetical protein